MIILSPSIQRMIAISIHHRWQHHHHEEVFKTWLLLYYNNFYNTINKIIFVYVYTFTFEGRDYTNIFALLSKARRSLLFFTFLLVITICSKEFLLMWSHCIISFCFFRIIGQMRIGRCQFLSRCCNLLWIGATLIVCCCACIWLIAPHITCTCSW